MISVLIISKNEEDVIEDCIKSVKPLADEIVIVDDSTDKTPQIAEKLGVRIINHSFKNFSDQRNYALEHALGDWVFYLDADEKVTPQFIKEVKEKINAKQDISGFFIKRNTFYFGKNWDYTDKVERIFKKSKLLGWTGIVHETPKVEGKLDIINKPIFHYTHRNLSQMLDKTNKWSEYEAKLRYESKHPKMNALRFIRIIVTGILKSYVKEKGYKNGTAGLVEAFYQGFSMFVTYSKLWEMQNKSS